MIDPDATMLDIHFDANGEGDTMPPTRPRPDTCNWCEAPITRANRREICAICRKGCCSSCSARGCCDDCDRALEEGEADIPADHDDCPNADGFFSPWMRPAYEPMTLEEEDAFRAFMAF